MSGKVNAKLKSVEDECESLRRSLFVEVDGRKELEGTVPGVCDLNECVTLIHRNLLLVIRNNIYVCVCVCVCVQWHRNRGFRRFNEPGPRAPRGPE